MENKFTPSHGMTEFIFQKEPIFGPPVDLFGIKVKRIPTMLLGMIPGNIGILQQGLGSVDVKGVEGYSDACGGIDFLLFQLEPRHIRKTRVSASVPEITSR